MAGGAARLHTPVSGDPGRHAPRDPGLADALLSALVLCGPRAETEGRRLCLCPPAGAASPAQAPGQERAEPGPLSQLPLRPVGARPGGRRALPVTAAVHMAGSLGWSAALTPLPSVPPGRATCRPAAPDAGDQTEAQKGSSRCWKPRALPRASEHRGCGDSGTAVLAGRFCREGQ